MKMHGTGVEIRYYQFGGETAVLSDLSSFLHEDSTSALNPITFHSFLYDSSITKYVDPP